jgi:Leucine-rich repeat (LRR) protein|tara:strand:- start:7048 stop:7788 length:741 start_codon:yes stop_codon:yes gene_type:complete
MKILSGARQTGSLGLSNLGINKRLPAETCHLHDKRHRFENEKFWDNVDLKFLDVAMNNLEELPSEIDRLDHLERLIARRNQIRYLPVQLCNLGTTLIYLDFKSNAVECLPVEIGRLYNLVEFDLEDNKLERLPDTIGNLQSLALFNVSKNRLVEFPETLGQLGKLEVLDCCINCLTTLPKSVGGLKKLLMLIAHHNKILELPHEIEGMVKLLIFDMSENLIGEKINVNASQLSQSNPLPPRLLQYQ